jgi:soluble lytic murein transglycosylase-like protein
MRRPLVLTCLLLAAWAEPTGNAVAPDSATGLSKVEKAATVAAAEPDSLAMPAETTEQLTDFDQPAVTPEPLTIESGDAFAALDAVADEYGVPLSPAVPFPPRRAIPHAVVCEALAEAAADNDLPTPFFIRLIWQESGFNQHVVSPAGAQGVAQFMPETAARHGLDDPFNPLQAVRASAHLLHDLFEQFGNLGLAAAAYNAGPRRVQDWLDKHAALPQETRDYVERITGLKAEQWKGKTGAAAQLRVPAHAPCQREAGLYAANGPEQIPMPPKPVVAVAKPAHGTVRSASIKAAGKPHKEAAQTPAKTTGKVHRKVRVADAERH